MVLDIRSEPTKRDLTIFGLLVAIFFALLAALAIGRPQTLWHAAIFTGCAVLVNLLFDRERRLATRLTGVTIPLLLVLIGGLLPLGMSKYAVAAVLIGVGAIGAAVILASPRAGKAIYAYWMQAAYPIGWTISILLLGSIYFLVVTPIGILMRLFGRDPLSRKFEPGSETYWTPHRPDQTGGRYFRQF